MNSFQTSRFCLFGETSVRSQTYWKRSHDTAGVLGEGVHRGFKCRGPPVGRPCNQSWTWRRKESDVQHKMRENSVRVCARACACVCACVCVCPQDNRQWQQQQLTRESLRLLSSPPHTHTHTHTLPRAPPSFPPHHIAAHPSSLSSWSPIKGLLHLLFLFSLFLHLSSASRVDFHVFFCPFCSPETHVLSVPAVCVCVLVCLCLCKYVGLYICVFQPLLLKNVTSELLSTLTPLEATCYLCVSAVLFHFVFRLVKDFFLAPS